MQEFEPTSVSRRHLLAMAGLSAGATLLAPRPLVADKSGIVPTMVNAAAKAKMEQGDVILSFGGQRVAAVDDLHRILTADRIGVPSPVSVLRGTGRRQLTVVPAERR